MTTTEHQQISDVMVDLATRVTAAAARADAARDKMAELGVRVAALGAKGRNARSQGEGS